MIENAISPERSDEAGRSGAATGVRVFRLVLPVAVLAGIAVAMIGLLAWKAAGELDRHERNHTGQIVASVLAARQAALGRLAADYAWWDEAVDQLASGAGIDSAWVDANIGSYLLRAFGVNASFVVRPDGTTRLAVVEGVHAATSAGALLGDAADVLVERARGGPMDRADPAVGLVGNGGTVRIVAASPLTREPPVPAGPRAPRSVLVLAQTVDAAVLAEIGRDYGVREPAFAAPGAAPGPDGLDLTGPAGSRVAGIVWRPGRPGRAMLARLAPGLAAILACILGLLGLVVRDARSQVAGQAALADALARERELAQLKARIRTTVSHEVRTPLAAIRTAVDLLFRHGERMTAADRERELVTMRMGVDRLNALVEGVLLIERPAAPEGGAGARIELPSLCRGVWAEVERATGTRRPLHLDVPDGLSPVAADEALLRTALAQLCGGVIERSAAGTPVRIDVALSGNRLAVTVSGRGTGPDGRRDPDAAALAATKAALDAAGGTLAVTGMAGSGTSVRLSLPCVPVTEGACP